MVNSSLLVMFLCLHLSVGQLKMGHSYLMEQFQTSAKPWALLSVETKYIKQPVDHFNSGDNREWDMMYCQNMDKWITGNAVYVYIGGEGPLSPAVLTNGLLYELAEETKGAMFATEHRFYGENKPFSNPTVADLKYLTSRQALADVANLIKQIKNTTEFSTSKVVVVGGSYAGNLAAWMRLKYSDLVDAAISSSAPVLAKLNYNEYLDTVGDDFKKYSKPECFQSITEKMDNCRDQLQSENGIKQLKVQYGICEENDLSKKDNQAIFFMSIIYDYGKKAQYGTIEEIKNYCNSQKVCQKLDDYCTNCEFDNIYNANFPKNYAYFWMYQTCNEFGYFMTAPNNKPFSSITLDEHYYIRICSTLYGPQFTRENIENNIKQTNSMFGGLNPAVTNVIFVNGEIDPWHRLGITRDLSETAPAKIIPGASHCNDLHNSLTDEVSKVQEEEKKLIRKWIGM